MRTRKLFIICLSIFLFPYVVWSQTQDALILTLDQCIAIALEQNPLILSSIQNHQASLARITQAKAFPQPSLEYNSDLQSQILNFAGSEESYIGARQIIEFPGRRALRTQIADREAQEIASDIDIIKLQLVFQVKQAFYSLLLAKEKHQYAKQDQELSEDYLKMAELKYSAGDVSRAEVLRARVEALKTANEVRVASNEVSLASATLNFFMARKRKEPLEVRGELKRIFIDMDIEKFQQEALTSRPELVRLRFSLEKEAYKQDQAKLNKWPDFDLGLSQHRISGMPSTWSFTLSVPLSFLFTQHQKGEYEEARTNAAALRRELEHIQNSILLEVEEASINSLKARDQIQLYENDILPQAAEVYDMFMFSYQEGAISGIELIEARKTLNEARKSYADSLFNHAEAVATLEKAIGRQY